MSSVNGGAAAPGQILTFHLDQEVFGVDIQRVREIRGWSPVTAVPETPSHVLGVLNLRGSIVPVIDLRARLGLERVTETATTVIIVLTVVSAQGKRDFGLVVDAVSDVADLSAKDIRATPPGITLSDRNSVPALATLGERMVLLLDVDGMLAGDSGVAL
ncbi:chemotaxis protein CheW [Steroidobacter sp.]|uniref:chemotaxis protein CheW n=1 Tax=Steroidobacter sp. TaxID=1978227 RepID=UPI001A494B87|nr:chemotaxis protein CheW [Steroidobacter sp.]MBL8266119.1 purine-binding chemotaxis protein CheW [Steroidobacter sp.]